MEREARRKRILSHGTDRIALITGRIQSLDPNLPLEDDLPVQHARSSSEPALRHDPAFFPDCHQGGDEVPGSQIRDDDEEEVSKGDSYGSRISPGIQSRSLVTTRVPRTSHDANFTERSFGLSSITPKEINSSIISSENTRAICSAVIAILVVLSNVNLPRNVVKSKSLIAYRPLYVVLLTDVLIVGGRLALYSQRKDEEREPKFEDDGYNWGGALKLLEVGLVLHQALRGIFIDCSFYLAIVVCGLSMA